MRMTGIVIVGVAAPAVAFGQPAAPGQPAPADEDAPCQAGVTLSRAPDDVRAVVDTWVHTEPSCSHALDVSVDQTDEGYVVNARDNTGRLRVRIVPDADTLGVLIASWSADDRIVSEARPDRPGERMTTGDRAAESPLGRRVLVAAVAGDATGVRGELDLFGHRVPVGIAGSAAWTMSDSQGDSQRWLQALAYLGVAFGSRQWQLRAQVGAGVQQTHSSVSYWDDAVDPITELSLTVSRELGAGCRLTGGVVITEPLSETYPYSDGAQYSSSRWNRPKPAALLGLAW